MNGNEYVPTLTDIWDFLLGFKAATEAGFARVDARLDVLAADVSMLKSDVSVLKSDVGVLKSDVGVLKSDVLRLERDLQRVERRVIRIDDRLSVIEDQRVGLRLDDHERRITRLEQQPT